MSVYASAVSIARDMHAVGLHNGKRNGLHIVHGKLERS